MAGLISWFGSGVKRVAHTVNNDLLKPVERDVVHPVAQAATGVARAVGNAPQTITNDVAAPIQRDVIRPVAAAPQNFARDVANPFIHTATNIAKPVYQNIKSIDSTGLNILKTPLEVEKAEVGAFTHNKIATANAVKGIHQGATAVRQLAQGTFQLPAQLVESVDPRGSDVYKRSFQPKGALEQAILGKQAIPTIQKQFKQTEAKSGRTQAITGAAITSLMDAAGIQGGLHSLHEAAPSIAKGVQKAPEVLNKLDDKAFTPRVSHNDQRTLQDMSNHLSHVKELKPGQLNGTIAQSRQIAQRYGVNIASGTPREQLEKVNSILDRVTKDNRATSEGGYAKLPGSSSESGKEKLPQTPKGESGKQPVGKASNAKGTSSNKSITEPQPPDFLKPSQKYVESQAKLASRESQKEPPQLGQLSKTTTKKLQSYGRDGYPTRGKEDGALGAFLDQGKSRPRSSVNHTTNPMKVNIAEVSPGDYGKARSNAQLASQPINYAAGQVSRVAKRLNLSTGKLGRLVEGTDKPANAAEREAVARYNQFSNRVHATSQALGGNTAYLPNYFHHEWDLENPEDSAKFEDFRQRKFGKELDPTQFAGLDTQPRVFDTVAQGEAAGFKLKNPEASSEVLDYGQRSAAALKRTALAKGFMEADANELDKPRSFDIGGGKTLALSEKGNHEIRGFEKSKVVNSPALKAYRGTNRKLKQTLLSLSEFHPINITRKVAPGLALEGHPVYAAKGVYGAFRGQIGRNYADKLQQAAFDDGTVDAAARIGTPIKFGTDYEAEGKLNLGRAGFGEKTIFEKSIPSLHIQAVRAVVQDLKDDKVALDSPEARAAGTRVNEMMGFVNTEVRNLDKGHQKFLSDLLLAPQFTRAKWATLKGAITGRGIAGSYARRAVLGDTLATGTTMLALGYLAKQKSDNIKDMLIRALIHPSVPTPFKDSNGNTIELSLPSTYASEALGLVANVTRGKDGHLGVSFNPLNLPSNVENYGRSRLAVLPNSALKVATNTDFAGKPLYDPNAPLGTKIQQAGTVLGGGLLPIGLQGATETNAVKQHLGSGIQNVLSANTPGSNPVLKSVLSSFGLTPRTDKTVGKGLQTTQYYSALDSASRGLNRQEKDAFDLYTGGKKNPVTGKYDVLPNANDARAKATVLLQNPKTIDHLISMNQSLAKQGQKVDPLWQQSKQNITKVLQYQAMPPSSADKTDWLNKNNSWYEPLSNQRTDFFNSLPPGDPNKPKLNIQYPNAAPNVQAAQKTYDSLTNSTAKGTFLDSHPELIKQWDAQTNYNNQMRTALGYSPLKNYPEPSAQLNKFLNNYTAADKTTRKGIRNANPQQYQSMIAYFDSLDLYNLGKQASVSQLQGEPNYTSKEAKSISSLAQDVYQNPDGTYSIVPAGWMNGLSNGSSGYGSSSSTGVSKLRSVVSASNAAIKPPKAPKSPNIKVKVAGTPSSYKKTPLKQYAVGKTTVGRSRKKALTVV